MTRLIIIIILVIFCIPILFTKEYKNDSEVRNVNYTNNNENILSKEEDKTNNKKIRVFNNKTNQVNEMDIEKYLLGVVAAEMPANFELEALKAQAIVARTYLKYNMENNKNKHKNSDICTDFRCCQAWISKEERFNKWNEVDREKNWLKIEKAVNETKGMIATYNGKAINAFFHSNSGGKTENVSEVWGGENLPYLQSIETSGEDGYSQYSSEIKISKKEFENKIKEKHNDFKVDFTKDEEIKIIEYTEGNRVKKIKIGNLNFTGVEIRTLFNLKSANFTIEINNENVILKVKGYGHGVGMSQTGADSLAKQGKKYDEIIKHFYKNIQIITM